MTMYITLSRSTDSYTETYEIRKAKRSSSRVVEEEMEECTAAFLGCILCSKVIVITAINPFMSDYPGTLTYSRESMFIPVYCGPCANKSGGFCENARVSKSMIMSTDAYNRVLCHANMNDEMRIHMIDGMFVIANACEFRHQLMNGDFVMVLDERSPMQLRRCKSMKFFADVRPFN